MAGISGQGTTFNLPNFVGELFSVTRNDTPLLSAIGGLTGGKETKSVLFQWQKSDLRDTTANNTVVEGANAPTAGARVRANVVNVCEIHHSAIEVSYTKQAATGMFDSTGSTHPGAVGIMGSNPVQDEMAFQIREELKAIAIDIEKSFISGSFSNPATNATARKTRGLLEAITTNVVDMNGASITEEAVLDLMEEVYQSGGITESDTATLITNSHNKRKLTKLFITDKDAEPRDRNVGGVNMTSFECDFGRVNIMLNRHMPQTDIIVCSLDELSPVFLNIPGKGFLFVEPLAKVGAAERFQIYGEVGLEYGLESHHGKIQEADTVHDS